MSNFHHDQPQMLVDNGGHHARGQACDGAWQSALVLGFGTKRPSSAGSVSAWLRGAVVGYPWDGDRHQEHDGHRLTRWRRVALTEPRSSVKPSASVPELREQRHEGSWIYRRRWAAVTGAGGRWLAPNTPPKLRLCSPGG